MSLAMTRYKKLYNELNIQIENLMNLVNKLEIKNDKIINNNNLENVKKVI
jgi:hypothetical protein